MCGPDGSGCRVQGAGFKVLGADDSGCQVFWGGCTGPRGVSERLSTQNPSF